LSQITAAGGLINRSIAIGKTIGRQSISGGVRARQTASVDAEFGLDGLFEHSKSVPVMHTSAYQPLMIRATT
jgi:hypothetical protein